jgi:hypothetical protein
MLTVLIITLAIGYMAIGMFVSILLTKGGGDSIEQAGIIFFWPVVMIVLLFLLPGFLVKYIGQKIWPEKKSNDCY